MGGPQRPKTEQEAAVTWLVMIGACGPLSVDDVEEGPSCEEVLPSIFAADDNYCAPVWSCCVGDPEAGDTQCWFQSGDPDLTEDSGLVWQCGGSLARCDIAQYESSEWACFIAPDPASS
jgi:hypothetical protein